MKLLILLSTLVLTVSVSAAFDKPRKGQVKTKKATVTPARQVTKPISPGKKGSGFEKGKRSGGFERG